MTASGTSDEAARRSGPSLSFKIALGFGIAIAGSATADVEDYLDEKGDRIEERLDRAGRRHGRRSGGG